MIAICSETRTKLLNLICEQKVFFLYVNPGGTCSNYHALKGHLFSLKLVLCGHIFVLLDLITW